MGFRVFTFKNAPTLPMCFAALMRSSESHPLIAPMKNAMLLHSLHTYSCSHATPWLYANLNLTLKPKPLLDPN